MGLAATQTRFLSLTARKSNIEYQGQQINQQRTVLSNKSANAYSEMLTLAVPVPPSTADFTKVQYQYTDGNITYQTTSYTTTKAEDGSNTITGKAYKLHNGEVSDLTNVAVVIDESTERITKINGQTATVVEVVDNNAYEDAYNQYLYKQYLYDQELQVINAQTEIIQQQDKALELQLNQLDTEQNEISTEMEALDKVLGDNVEDSYKTFGG